MLKRSTFYGLLAAAGLALSMPSSALSSEPQSNNLDAQANPWEFNFMPYLWALNLDYDITVRGVNGSGYASAIDLVENSDRLQLFEGHFEARRGPLSFFLFGDYLNARFSEGFFGVRTRSVSVMPGPRLAANITLRAEIEAAVELELEATILDFGGAYEIFRRSKGYMASLKDPAPGSSGFTALDVVFGGRYTSFDASADLQLNVNFEVGIDATLSRVFRPVRRPPRRPTQRTVTRRLGVQRQFFANISQTEQWVDPFVGLRLRDRSATGWEWWLRGDVGGFGLASDFTWQLMGGLGKEWHWRDKTLAWFLGYRALDTDYSSGAGRDRFEYNMLIHGPVSGLSFRF